MGNQVRGNSKKANKKKGLHETIGILSFEAANAMSKIIHLHKSLSENEILKLKNETLISDGIKTLISNDDNHLLNLSLREKLDDLTRISGVVSRLGTKCTIPALQRFEHVYADVTSGVIGIDELSFLVKDMDSMIKKMERYVGSTVALYAEMEVVSELELAIVKFERDGLDESRRAFEQKLTWQKQDVRHFKSVSLWNRTYDKVVELMARTVCTVYARLYVVLGDNARDSSRGNFYSVSLSRSRVSSVGRRSFQKDASLRKSHSSTKNGYSHPLGAKQEFHKNGRGSFRPRDFNFSCCNSASKVDDDNDDDDVTFDDDDDESVQISSFIDAIDSDRSIRDHMIKSRGNLVNCPKFGPSSSLPPTTLGGSALALHYANIIIVLEKLLKYPHLVGDEARDDLYQMLPTSLRENLKTSLGSYVTDLFIYDAPMEHHWRGRIDSMLRWLAPLAYNTMRWQNERKWRGRIDSMLRWLAPLAYNTMRWQNKRNFEQQQIVTRTNVLLVQTLYFADREKTEAVVCEVLVGLNYMCRYEQQQNVMIDCSSSFDFEDRLGALV